MAIQEKIDNLRKDIKSDRLSMSIGELAGLYERREVDIHPKFQRVLRWDREQKSRLIESILLRIPIPPVFVAQDSNGRWDVVDGVQRLGTIFEFLGILRDANGALKAPLVLGGTHLLPELSDMVFVEGADKHFPQAMQLDFNRSRLDIQILLKESDPTTKYELFERLNTGGSTASDQEVRNCVLVWINEGLFDWLQEYLANDAGFRICVELPERMEEQQYRMELVLRFLAFLDISVENLTKVRDIGQFLNEKNRDIASRKRFDRRRTRSVFHDTFDILSKTLGANSFRKYYSDTGQFRGGFLISAYEAVALGVAYNIDAWRKLSIDEARTRLQETSAQMWSDERFTSHIGVGVPARDRIRWSVPFGREYFEP